MGHLSESAMVGKWYEDRVKPGRFYFTLAKKHSKLDLGADEDMYYVINMPIELRRYIRTHTFLSELEQIENIEHITKLNRICIKRTFSK